MYKVGDRVIAIKEVGDKDVIDVPGTIINIDRDGDYLVEFDKYIAGHDGTPWGNIKGKYGYCWWCRPCVLSKLKEKHETVLKPTNVDCGMGLYLKISDKEVEVKTTDGRTGVAKCHPDDKFDVLEGLKVAVDRALNSVVLTDRDKAYLIELQKMGCSDVIKHCFSDDVEEITAYNDKDEKIASSFYYGIKRLESLRYDTYYNISDLLKEGE